jgi:hypothetical protein
MVMYDTTDFLEKNKDQLHPDVVTMLHTTTSDLVKTCLPPPPVKGGSKKKSATLCSAFKKSLAELIATLQTTEPHFVRCMKPNKEKIGGNFTSAMMLEQMRYSGLLEVCRIRKLGYPLRKDYKDFAKRYGTIVRGTKSVDELLKGLEEKGVLKAGMWAKGTTKIFMKAPQSVDLEVAREDSLLETAVICQKYARRYVMKVKMKTWKKELDLLKGAIAKRTEEALEEALNNTSELPGNGKHLQIVKDASALLVRIQEEKRVVAFLSKAIEKHDKSLLVQAIESAEKMDFAPPELGAAREALSKIKQEEALIAALKDCVAARDRSALDAKLGECADFGIPDDNEVVAQAQALSHRLAEDCAECNRWFGWSRPNLRLLPLGHIDVDSADFWTNRLLSSSSRSQAKEVASKPSHTRTSKSGWRFEFGTGGGGRGHEAARGRGRVEGSGPAQRLPQQVRRDGLRAELPRRTSARVDVAPWWRGTSSTLALATVARAGPCKQNEHRALWHTTARNSCSSRPSCAPQCSPSSSHATRATPPGSYRRATIVNASFRAV